MESDINNDVDSDGNFVDDDALLLLRFCFEHSFIGSGYHFLWWW